MKRLKKLYAAEVNGSLSWFFDGLVTAKLGDEHNGFKAEATFETIDEAVDWLWLKARVYYPDCPLWK